MPPPALGPYTLLRRIGVGGMGEVWIARREAIGGAAKLVALKTVLPEKAGNAEFRRMFLDEARLAMLMNNSNIVQVFDVDETPESLCYMAMEYVEGVDLGKLTEALRMRGELLSHSVIAYIIGEILKALAYAHDHSIEGIRRTVVHRDISPQNVMMSSSGEVKVTDFGIARLASEETSGSFVRGKFRYMPPEQFERGIRAPTLDLFAVGAILHELLEGKRFRGGEIEEAELIGMCVRGLVPPLTCAPGRVPPVFERLRLGLLEAKAGKRIQTARDAHRLLSEWPGNRDGKFELEDIVQSILGDSSLRMLLVATTDSGRSARSNQSSGSSTPLPPRPAPAPASAPAPSAAGALAKVAAPAGGSRYAGAAARARGAAGVASPAPSASPTRPASPAPSASQTRPASPAPSASQTRPASPGPTVSPAPSPTRPGAPPSSRPLAQPAAAVAQPAASRPRAPPSSRPGAPPSSRPGAPPSSRPGAPSSVSPAGAPPVQAAAAPVAVVPAPATATTPSASPSRPSAPPTATSETTASASRSSKWVPAEPTAQPASPPASTPDTAVSKPRKRTVFLGSRADTKPPEPAPAHPPTGTPHTQVVDLDSIEFLEVLAEHRAEAALRDAPDEDATAPRDPEVSTTHVLPASAFEVPPMAAPAPVAQPVPPPVPVAAPLPAAPVPAMPVAAAMPAAAAMPGAAAMPAAPAAARSSASTSTRTRSVPTARRNRSAYLAIALLVFGLAFGLVGIGAALGWFSPDEPSTIASNDAPTESAPTEPPTEPPPPSEPPPTEPAGLVTPPSEPPPTEPPPTEPASESTTEVIVDDSGAVDSDTSGDIELDIDDIVEPPPPEPVAGPPKTSVTITATGAWVQIKIGNYKPYTIDKLKGIKQVVTKIRPGEYKIAKRLDAKSEWKPLGKVKIPEARTASVFVNGDLVTAK